jgi:ppGpp synthetase/RelA/SpoT-type nucleotidyltranferase
LWIPTANTRIFPVSSFFRPARTTHITYRGRFGLRPRISINTMIFVTADKLPNMHSTTFRGIPIVIEWPKGSVRVGERDNGEPFKTEMKADYGYIPDTVAAGDDERLDIYVGPDKDSENVYVVEQVDKATGDFDEYKIMLGFDSLEDAEEIYAYHAESKGGDKEAGDISEMPFDYLFDTVMQERHETKAEEEQDTRAEIEQDEVKTALLIDTDEIALEPSFVGRPPAKFKRSPARQTRRWEDFLERYGWSEQRENVWVNHSATTVMILTIGKTDLPDKWGNWYDELSFKVLDAQKQVVAQGESSQDFLNALNAWSGEIKTTRLADHGEKLSLIEAFVKLYKHEFEYFNKVAEEVNDQLADALQEAGIKAAVTFRAKKPRKLRAKLQKRNETRNYQSFQDIYNDIVDLAGVRVGLYLPADREAVGEIIDQAFTSMRKPKNFPEDRGPGDGLGYIATHYLVRLKPETLHKDELQYADTNVEIQVASVLMHAWSEVTHDLIYKPEKGTLTPEEIAMIDDLNKIVQEGEATLTRLQHSVENRQQTDLRFELAAALTKLATRLNQQSHGIAKRRITASEVKATADKIQATVQDQPSPHVSYLRAKLALWKAHGGKI